MDGNVSWGSLWSSTRIYSSSVAYLPSRLPWFPSPQVGEESGEREKIGEKGKKRFSAVSLQVEIPDSACVCWYRTSCTYLPAYPAAGDSRSLRTGSVWHNSLSGRYPSTARHYPSYHA